MTFDSAPGLPYATGVRVLNAFGSPVTSGVTGNITLYGHDSTTAVAGPSALTHLGEGVWGVEWSATVLANPGTYHWATTALGGTGNGVGAQTGFFAVGYGDEWTLRELLVAVRLGIRDGWPGLSTGAGSTTTLVAAAFVGGSDNAWASSELLLLEPPAPTDPNPVKLTASTAASGTLTWGAGQALSGASGSGKSFLVGNKGGQRWPHAEVMDAITTAIRRYRTPRPVWDQVSIVPSSLNTYEFALPAGWTTVESVAFRPTPGVSTTQWVPIAPVYWRVPDDRMVLALERVPWNCPLRIGGRAVPAVPRRLTERVRSDGATVRDDAVYELLVASDRRSDQQRAAMLAPTVLGARAAASLGRL